VRRADSWVRGLAVAAVCSGIAPLVAVAQQPPSPGAHCPTPGVHVGTITIERLDVFDNGSGAGRGWIARGANVLHVRTRETVVRRELLFEEGGRCDEEALAQSERNVRGLGLFRKVEIVTRAAGEDAVDVLVRVRDAFSLRTSASYKREGGADAWDARFGDTNLAGLGHGLSLRRSHNFERDVTSAAFADQRFFGSRERLAVTVDRRSDGGMTQLSLARPFHALDTRWSHDLGFTETRDRLRTYEAGEVDGEWTRRAVDASAGVAVRLSGSRHNQAWRVSGGFRFASREYGDPGNAAPSNDIGPTPRRLAGPFAGIHFVSHRYVKRAGLITPERDFDLNLGLAADVGVAISQRLRSLETQPQTAVTMGLSRGWVLPAGGVAVATGSGVVELERRARTRADFSVTARAWWPRSPLHVRAALVELHALVNPDAGRRRYLGGTPGLRGYRQNAFAGHSSLLAVVEERRYGTWTPLGLFRPGVVVFAEAGVVDDRGIGDAQRAPGAIEATSPARFHADVGVGPRIASLRSSSGTGLRLDVAFPMERAAGRSRTPLVAIGYRSDF